MRVRRNYIFIALAAIVLLPVFIFIFSFNNDSVKASSHVQFDYAESLDFEGNTVTYDTENRIYARRIKLYYNVFSPYYIVEVRNKADVILTATQALEPSDGRGEFEVTHNGELTVYCYATDEQGVKLENTRIFTLIRSDNLSPNSAHINQMTGWRRHANGYLVNILLSSDNGNSGIRRADITIIYNQDNIVHRAIEAPATNDSFTIYEECNIAVIVYDNAGNAKTDVYVFDKFDSTKPTPPVINLIPEKEVSEETNGYARNYYVTISFGEDEGSGIDSSSMKYTLNGEIYNYAGGFNLNEQKNYIITAYYQDNAGNTSDVASVEVKNMDRIEPSITSVSLSVNLMKDKPYKITIACSDTNSGINRIVAEGINTQFVRIIYNIYEGEFTYLDKAVIKITVYDNVGNFRSTNIITHHFANLDIEDIAVKYYQKYKTLDSEEYSQTGWGEIVSLYSDLNIMLMTETTTLAEFEFIASKLDAAIEGKTKYSYKITSVPNHMSALLTYSINEDDIQNIKKGDTVLMTLSDTAFDESIIVQYTNIALTKSDFKKCFITPFKLAFYHNGNEIDYNLENGIRVSMPVPAGYEARFFAVMNMETQQLTDIEVINNRITFKIYGGGPYALITEGEIITNTPQEIKGINFFGKTISYLAFGLSLGGVVLLTAAAITLLSLKHRNTSDK